MKQCAIGKQLWPGFKSSLGILALLAALGLTACSSDEGNNASVENKANATSAPPISNADATQMIDQPSANESEEPDLAAGAKDNFGKFAIEVGAAPEIENYKLVAVKHSGKLLRQDEDPYRAVTPGAELRDFPLPGCESMTLELFTGGANCCFGYYILTACPDEDAAAFSAPADGGLGEATAVTGEVKGFVMSDPAFMYYSPQSQANGASALSLNRVESPRPTRYVIFADKNWRADKLGEFTPAYQALAAEAEAAEQGGKTAGRAITLAYYAHMGGADAAEVKAVLKAELPTEFADLSDTIFDDIVKAAAKFNPFEQLPLP